MERLRGQVEIPSGRPYPDLDRAWSMEALEAVARLMGKRANPNNDPDFEADLENGALVLLNDNEVIVAAEKGLIPMEWKEALISDVTRRNELLVIPKSAFQAARRERKSGLKVGPPGGSYSEATKYCYRAPYDMSTIRREPFGSIH